MQMISKPQKQKRSPVGISQKSREESSCTRGIDGHKSDIRKERSHPYPMQNVVNMNEIPQTDANLSGNDGNVSPSYGNTERSCRTAEATNNPKRKCSTKKPNKKNSDYKEQSSADIS